MRRMGPLLAALLLALTLAGALPALAEEAAPAAAPATAPSDPQLAEELRRIHREIAALRADLDKPGLPQVFSGLGYILGLFGLAAFVAARRKER